jgi:hypothetical protein
MTTILHYLRSNKNKKEVKERQKRGITKKEGEIEDSAVKGHRECLTWSVTIYGISVDFTGSDSG